MAGDKGVLAMPSGLPAGTQSLVAPCRNPLDSLHNFSVSAWMRDIRGHSHLQTPREHFNQVFHIIRLAFHFSSVPSTELSSAPRCELLLEWRLLPSLGRTPTAQTQDLSASVAFARVLPPHPHLSGNPRRVFLSSPSLVKNCI